MKVGKSVSKGARLDVVVADVVKSDSGIAGKVGKPVSKGAKLDGVVVDATALLVSSDSGTAVKVGKPVSSGARLVHVVGLSGRAWVRCSRAATRRRMMVVILTLSSWYVGECRFGLMVDVVY